MQLIKLRQVNCYHTPGRRLLWIAEYLREIDDLSKKSAIDYFLPYLIAMDENWPDGEAFRSFQAFYFILHFLNYGSGDGVKGELYFTSKEAAEFGLNEVIDRSGIRAFSSCEAENRGYRQQRLLAVALGSFLYTAYYVLRGFQIGSP